MMCSLGLGSTKELGLKAEHSENRREKEQSEVGFQELSYLQTQVNFISGLLETSPTLMRKGGRTVNLS